MVNAVSPLVAASTVQQTSWRTSPKTLNFARTVCATKYFAANQHVAVTSSVPKKALFQMIPRMKLCAAAVLALTLVESKPRGCHYCSSELLQHTDEQMNLTSSVWCTCQHWLTCYWPSPIFLGGPGSQFGIQAMMQHAASPHVWAMRSVRNRASWKIPPKTARSACQAHWLAWNKAHDFVKVKNPWKEGELVDEAMVEGYL